MAVLKYYDTGTSSWQYIAASTTANFTTWKKTVAGGETSVSGTDDNAVTLSYTVGLEQVFINGVLQVRGSDYVATTGTSITGLSTLAVNDVVTVVCYAPFNVANTIAPTLVDAKGDLLVGTAADTVGRLAVGTNNQLLAADSSTATGLKWANPGLTLIKTESFSSVTAVNINNVFTSTYDNYYIEIDFSVPSTGGDTAFKLRSSGTDKSTNYSMTGTWLSGTTVQSYGTGTTTLFYLALAGVAELHLIKMNVSRPAISGQTAIMADILGSTDRRYIQTGRQTETTTFDGFTFYNVGSNNMSGKIKVFGVNQ